MKTFRILKSKFKKASSVSSSRLNKNKVRVKIESLCEQYLVNPDDVLVFEALPYALDSTVSVLEDSSLSSKYDFEQLDNYLFSVWMKRIDLV